MSEIRRWPTCETCSAAHGGGWVPVEEYEVVEDKPGPRYRARFHVIARCSHGKGFKASSVQTQTSQPIDVPVWWGEAHVLDAIQVLRFFVPGNSRPEHGMVTSFS